MSEDLTSIDGVGPAIADHLREAGFETVDDVHDADVEELADVHLLGEASARDILGEPTVPKEEWPEICERALEYRENNHDYIQQCKRWLGIIDS